MTKNEQRFALRMNMIVDLYDSGCYSFEDIGMVFGITKERVRQVYRKGTGRVALSDWVLTEFLHSIENAPTVEITEEQERPTGDCKCVTCKYCDVKIINKPCRTCSHAWKDLYEETEE